MLSLTLAGLTGILRKNPLPGVLSARVAGFLCVMLIVVGTLLGAAWAARGHAAAEGSAPSATRIPGTAPHQSFSSSLDRW